LPAAVACGVIVSGGQAAKSRPCTSSSCKAWVACAVIVLEGQAARPSTCLARLGWHAAVACGNRMQKGRQLVPALAIRFKLVSRALGGGMHMLVAAVPRQCHAMLVVWIASGQAARPAVGLPARGSMFCVWVPRDCAPRHAVVYAAALGQEVCL
jgi:hypothetical protein